MENSPRISKVGELSTIHVGSINLRDEVPVRCLICICWCLLYNINKSHVLLKVVLCLIVLVSLSLTQLQENKFFFAQSSSETLFKTNVLVKCPHFLKMHAEICSYLFASNYKVHFEGGTSSDVPTFLSRTLF